MIDPDCDLWKKFPLAAQIPYVRSWLERLQNLGRSPNTVSAYGSDINDLVAFCNSSNLDIFQVTSDDIEAWIGNMFRRPDPRKGRKPRAGMARSTIIRRLSSASGFFDYLLEKNVIKKNPVTRGSFDQGAPSRRPHIHSKRGLVKREQLLPVLPTDDQLTLILETARLRTLRTRAMLILQLDCALRREELILLEVGDFNWSKRHLTIRPETAKNGSSRVLPFTAETQKLVSAYLQERRRLVIRARPTNRLWLSCSPRNRGSPISVWTWSKEVEQLAKEAQVCEFSTHSMRHIRLTDLARSNWDLHEIAAFAGHRDLRTTQIYITLSARDLEAAFTRTNESLQSWRMSTASRLLA